MTNERGMITVDFLFAFVLVMGFSALLFALSFSLTVAEITQYITFASARTYMAGNLTRERQYQLGQAKYQELKGHAVFAPLYGNGWFEISPEAVLGDMAEVVPGYQQSGTDPNKFWGAGTTFIARMLEFEIPFYGSTASQGDGSGSGFATFMGSYLGREITAAECLKFTAERWKAIRALPVQGAAAYNTNTSENGYWAYDDNGC